MVEEGARVRFRSGSAVVHGHPELRDAVGIVGSVVRGASWQQLGASVAERARDITLHIRFRELNVVALSVPADDVEPVDHLSPKLRLV